MESPGFTYLGSAVGNSFRYSFEFDLPVGAGAMAFEFVSEVDEFGTTSAAQFKDIIAGSANTDATIGSNGWSVLGDNGDQTVFFMEGQADQRLSFDVVFLGDLSDTVQWSIWFYSVTSRETTYDPLAGWDIIDNEISDTGTGSRGGRAPDYSPGNTSGDPTVIPLPNPFAMGLIAFAPLVMARRRSAG